MTLEISIKTNKILKNGNMTIQILLKIYNQLHLKK